MFIIEDEPAVLALVHDPTPLLLPFVFKLMLN